MADARVNVYHGTDAPTLALSMDMHSPWSGTPRGYFPVTACCPQLLELSVRDVIKQPRTTKMAAHSYESVTLRMRDLSDVIQRARQYGANGCDIPTASRTFALFCRSVSFLEACLRLCASSHAHRSAAHPRREGQANPAIPGQSRPTFMASCRFRMWGFERITLRLAPVLWTPSIAAC